MIDTPQMVVSPEGSVALIIMDQEAVAVLSSLIAVLLDLKVLTVADVDVILKLAKTTMRTTL